MKFKIHFSIVILAFASLLRAGDIPNTLTIDASKPGIHVSPTLYGIFFEEVNRAGDGGLYAEMIDNRSFEDSDKLIAWKVKTGTDVQATATIDRSRPIHPNNPSSLRIEVTRTGADGISITNEGFQGLSVVKGSQYVARLYARCDDAFKVPLNLRLSASDGSNPVQAEVGGIGKDWKEFEVRLTAPVTDAHAKLTIVDNAPGVVWIDMVSLFPDDTWKSGATVLRTDLADKLDSMHPAFMRFPGGCWVEGETPERAYRWKDTIGDISQRKSNYDLWKYTATNGLGYYEYLQLAEALGAEPLFVVNCGMSLAEQGAADAGKPVVMQGVDRWVQDALDAIEYANGSPETEWGAKRAKAGHPAPFNLKYMEIGNENGGVPYDANYALFYDAIKKRYPAMNLIANLLHEAPKSRPVEILDEHYYNSPEFFYENSNRYDKYDRKGSKIYVGEYAVTEKGGTGNVRGAVAEAAFMTGMERNGDVVVMASYAPLFANTHYTIWNPNAINFDASRSYGTPSYWVQQMFSRNRAERILPAQMTNATAKNFFYVAGRAGEDVVIKVANGSEKDQPATLDLRGLSHIDPKGTAIVLTGKPEDENTLDEPLKIQPRTTEIENVSNTFTHTFPASSVTILRLKAK